LFYDWVGNDVVIGTAVTHPDWQSNICCVDIWMSLD